MSIELRNRLRNYWFWFGLFSFIALIAKQYNLFEVPPNYEDLVNMFLGLFVMLGILNNPNTENKGLSDDKKDDYMYKIGGSK